MSTPPASAVLQQTPPSAIALSISSLLLGLVAGYFIGSGSSIGLFSSPKQTPKTSKRNEKQSWPNSYDVDVHVDSSDEELLAKANATSGGEADDEEETDSDEEAITDLSDGLKSFANSTEEIKLMLIVRTDLGMTKGKIAAQCSHATLAVYKALSSSSSLPSKQVLKKWESHGQPKIAVKCESEDELLTLQAQALSLGLVARSIRDAGRTQIAAGSMTVLGVLGPKGVVDQVTGGLKLL